VNNRFKELEQIGQSVWLDNISRDILINKELQKLIEEVGLKGVTSNPTIFQKAIGSGSAYNEQIKQLLSKNNSLSADELFEELAVTDIQNAADVLFPVYKKTDGVDGFVSIEVSPILAYNTEGTINAARRLNKKVNRPNVMIKIPATQEGLPAIMQMISEGVCINVTLIFSQQVYEQVVEAYVAGLEERNKKNGRLNNIVSVASFFISRIDTYVDKELDKVSNTSLKGKIAIANAKMVYEKSKEIFSTDRFKLLKDKGTRIQRLLWASTSTKNPSYAETIYIDELIGKDTVNTMPPATIEAFKTKGKVYNAIEDKVDEARRQMQSLKDLNIDFSEITKKLTIDGVESFANSFHDLISTIENKKKVENSK
jgi:transaldolase / glucose-6-phosphate isomerase